MPTSSTLHIQEHIFIIYTGQAVEECVVPTFLGIFMCFFLELTSGFVSVDDDVAGTVGTMIFVEAAIVDGIDLVLLCMVIFMS